MKKILLIIVMLACIAGYGQTGATRGGSGTGATTYLPKGDTTGELFYWDNTNKRMVAAFGNKLKWDATNSRLGIGTNAPSHKLEVVGTIHASASGDVFNGYYGHLKIQVATNGQITFYAGNSNPFIYTAAGYDFKANYSGTYGNFLIRGGNVGIGTTSPTTKLQVKDGVVTIGVGAGTNSGTVTIDTVNAIRLTGKAIVWDDLMFPFSTGLAGGLSYPTNVPDSGYYTFVVDTTGPTKCIQYMTIQMPHAWAYGYDSLYPHVHYKHETGVGTPNFIIKYRWVNIGDPATPVAWNWCRLDLTTGTTDKTHQMAYASKNISSAGKGISSILMVQVYLRDTPTNVNAYQFDIHFPINSMGSNTTTSKD